VSEVTPNIAARIKRLLLLRLEDAINRGEDVEGHQAASSILVSVKMSLAEARELRELLGGGK